MILFKQLIGPFKLGETFNFSNDIDRRFKKISIQCKEIQSTIMSTNNPPKYNLRNENNELVRETDDIPALSSSALIKPIIEINGNDKKNFMLNEHGILEFDDLNLASLNIKFLQNLPAETIIDVMVEDILD